MANKKIKIIKKESLKKPVVKEEEVKEIREEVVEEVKEEKKEVAFPKGSIVKFSGKQYFTQPNGKIHFSVSPGEAEVVAVMKNAKYPYYLIATRNSESNIKGWVTEEDIAGLVDKKQIEVVSFADSRQVKICIIKTIDNNMNIISENWEDQNWTELYRAKDPVNAEKIAATAEDACAKKNLKELNSKSALINLCLKATKVKNDEEVTQLSLIKTGLFNCFTSDFYTKKVDFLRRGDILISSTYSADRKSVV